ncbi:MAG: LamG domain-containing protein, partial [Bacteroidales bacterium]|nr:LamG domain-containing protein [Bacteroidales bacterium]
MRNKTTKFYLFAYHYMRKIVRTFAVFLLLFFIVGLQDLFGHSISSSIVSGYDASHIKQGYVKFNFKYYDEDGRDDYLDNVDLHLYVDGKDLGTVLKFNTDDQGNNHHMWIDLGIMNQNIICKATGTHENGIKDLPKGKTERFYNYAIGDWTSATVTVYFSPDVLLQYAGKSFVFAGHVEIGLNARVDTSDDITTAPAIFPQIDAPQISYKLSSDAGYYDVTIENKNASSYSYFYYSDKIEHKEEVTYGVPSINDAIKNLNFDPSKEIINGNTPYYFINKQYKLIENPDYIPEGTAPSGDPDPSGTPAPGPTPNTTPNDFGTIELQYNKSKIDSIANTYENGSDITNLLKYINNRISDEDIVINSESITDVTNLNYKNSTARFLVAIEYKPIDVVKNNGFTIFEKDTFGNCPYIYDIDATKNALTKINFTPTDKIPKIESQQGTIEFPVSNKPKKLYVYYCHVISDYQTCVKYVEYELPAYQFPEAKNCTFENLENGATKISFDIEVYPPLGEGKPARQIEGDKFEIIRSLDNSFLSYKTLAPVSDELEFVRDKKTYTIIDKTGDYNINGNVYYRIRRTSNSKNWQWDYYTEVCHSKTMHHTNVKGGLVEFNYDPTIINGIKLNIHLDKPDNYLDKEEANSLVLTEKSKIVIVRRDITSQTEQKYEIDIEKDEDDKWIYDYEWTEELTKSCREYSYSAYVKPGNSNYTTLDPVELEFAPGLDKILVLQSGRIENLEVSTGYYSDRVDLRWDVVDGALDSYSVERKEFGQPDDKYNLIENVEGAPSATKVMFSDKDALTGKIYSYRVTGKAGCATEIIETGSLTSYGFRTQTGDFYGQVTFENGQGEDSVEIRVETKDYIPSYALKLESSQTAQINNNDFLTDVTKEFTFQSWIKPTTEGKIFEKSGMYTIEYVGGKIKFTAGDKSVTSQSSLNTSKFTHITAGVNKDSLYIFINGDFDNSLKEKATITSNTNQSVIGENFAGYIDEVRIFSRSLKQNEIYNDYNRYVLGDQDDLILYYNFNYCFDDKVFDMSYLGSDYNKNDAVTDGEFTSATGQTPTQDQLWYKALTDNTGHYSLRGVPFIG